MYPHTTTSSDIIFRTPDNLKGVYILTSAIFQSLGLKVAFRPTLDDDYVYHDYEIGHQPVDLINQQVGPVDDWGCSSSDSIMSGRTGPGKGLTTRDILTTRPALA